MEKLNLNKKVYAKNQYEKVIDTKFSQLATSPPPNAPPPSSISVDEFFQNYNDIFFQIPKLGATNSHEYIIRTSSEYVDANTANNDLQALIDEINVLQQQNLELNQQLVNSAISSSQQV
jgi:hypothetical protein